MKHTFWRWWPGVALAALSAVAGTAFQFGRVEDAASADAPEISGDGQAVEYPLSEAAIDDLVRLRAARGLALSDDYLTGSTDDESFKAHLQRLAGIGPPMDDVAHDPSEAQQPSGEPTKPTPPLPVDVVSALRASAFELEKAAHLLECHTLYERSDEVRRLAQEMRQDARERAAAHKPCDNCQPDFTRRPLPEGQVDTDSSPR